jgi:gliding motility-associated-like protein
MLKHFGNVISIMLFCVGSICAQKRNNVWAFGIQSGLDFNKSQPVLFKSKVNAEELPYYISSICDKKGNLMFYTDGRTVWNRDNFELPKYKNWWFLSGDTLMPLICPYPDSDSLFYLFGIGNGINKYQLQYITIRMRQSGDIEEVVYPQPTDPKTFHTKLLDNASVVLTGTSHCNQKDYWITAYGENSLYSFLVNSTGVSKTPIESKVPSSIISNSRLFAGNSNIKMSANSEKFVIPLINESQIVVYDFDNYTGKFSNPIKLNLPSKMMLNDVELSPDGTKLYIACSGPDADEPTVMGHIVAQMNLTSGNQSQIEASFLQLNEVVDRETCTPHFCFLIYRAMQLGPDGRIYIGMRYADDKQIKLDQTLSVIEEPNKKGIQCSFRRNQISIGLKYKFLGYNYIRSGSFSLKQNGIQIRKKNCSDKPVDFFLLFNNIDSVKWNFGDLSSGADNYSTSLTPQHLYPGPGSYTAHAIIYKNCIADTAIAIVTIEPNPSVHVPAFIKDTIVCVGDQLNLNVRTPQSKEYVWDNGLIYPDRVITEAGHYRVTVMNDCSIDQKEFNVDFQQCPCSVFIPNAFTPNGDGSNDVFRPVFKCVAKNYKLKIYDRYGSVIFETRKINEGWNGKKINSELPNGVYVWLMEYTNPNTKQTILKNGTVALIR